MGKKKQSFLIALALLAAVQVAGCKSVRKGFVEKANVRPLAFKVLDRHDRLAQEAYSGEWLAEALEQSKKARESFSGDGFADADDLEKFLVPCIQRHDDLIAIGAFSDEVQSVYLLSSENLLALVSEARSKDP